MGLFSKWKESREDQTAGQTLEDILLSAYVPAGKITRPQALSVPAVSSCVEIISNTIASLDVYLYQEDGKKVKKIDNDVRVRLLNDDTRDTLDAFQHKKALVEDYLLDGGGYSYIQWVRNKVQSLHYVENPNLVVSKNADPIFKKYEILINGNAYQDFDFLKVLRKTRDGINGKGIIQENNKLLSVAYNTLVFEDVLVKTGGSKKGFLKSKNKLTREVIDEMKKAWSLMFSNTDSANDMIILNDGMDFVESSGSSVEMQLNERKVTNANEICKIFNVPPSVLDGTASEIAYNNWIRVCIYPILTAIETALNRDLLLPSEKQKSFYYAFDRKKLMQIDIEKQMNAYKIGVDIGAYQIDEVRYDLDLEPLGLPFIKLGLDAVLYNPNTGEIYTPNTDKTSKMGETSTPEEDPKPTEDVAEEVSVEGGDNNNED